MNIVLIGFKSAGKTMLGQELAKKMQRGFFDIDDKVVEIYQQKHGRKLTVRQIYLNLGDAGFRALEKQAILSLAVVDNAVIATGGGSVSVAENVQILSRNGKYVYLDVPKEILHKRISNDSTLDLLDPRHPAKNFEQTFAIRQKIYQEIADLILTPEGKTIKDMVKIIEEAFYGK